MIQTCLIGIQPKEILGQDLANQNQNGKKNSWMAFQIVAIYYQPMKKHIQILQSDPIPKGYIWRFVTMSEDFVCNARQYLISKNETVKISSREIFDGLQWSLQVNNCGKGYVEFYEGVWDKIYEHAASIIARWNSLSHNPTIAAHLQEYIRKHQHVAAHQQIVLKDNDDYKQVNYSNNKLFVDIENIAAQKVTLDEWMDISWQPKETGPIVISELSIWLSFCFKFGKTTSITLGDHDNASPKDGTCNPVNSTQIPLLFSTQEFENAAKINSDKGVQNDVLAKLSKKTKQLVKSLSLLCFFGLFGFILALFFLIVWFYPCSVFLLCCFVCYQLLVE